MSNTLLSSLLKIHTKYQLSCYSISFHLVVNTGQSEADICDRTNSRCCKKGHKNMQVSLRYPGICTWPISWCIFNKVT